MGRVKAPKTLSGIEIIINGFGVPNWQGKSA